MNRMMQIAPRILMLVDWGLLVIKEDNHIAPSCGPDTLYLPVPDTKHQQGQLSELDLVST